MTLEVVCKDVSMQVGPILRALGSFESASDIDEVQDVFRRWTAVLDGIFQQVLISRHLVYYIIFKECRVS